MSSSNPYAEYEQARIIFSVCGSVLLLIALVATMFCYYRRRSARRKLEREAIEAEIASLKVMINGGGGGEIGGNGRIDSEGN